MMQQQSAAQDKMSHNAAIHDEIEESEVEPQTKATFYDKICGMVEKCAATHWGQFVAVRGNRALKVIEETAKWSLPQERKDFKLERPLPWIPFLLMILWLRVVRMWLSVGAVIIGNEPISPQAVVYFIQTRRRKLRALRVRGLKEIRLREFQSTSAKKETAVRTVFALLSMAICKPGQQCDEPARHIFIRSGEGKQISEDTTSFPERPSKKRPRSDESVDQNLTVDEMLSKYADEDSDEDSDFIPNPEDESTESNISTTTTSTAESIEKENTEDTVEVEKAAEPLVPVEVAAHSNSRAAAEKETSEKRSAQKKSDKNEPNDECVELRENGGTRKRLMPKPLTEIKQEPISDIDSGNEGNKTPRENAAGDGCSGGDGVCNTLERGESAEVALNSHVAPKHPTHQANRLNVAQVEPQGKSTPGHESAALMKPLVLSAIGGTAAAVTVAGSPQEFPFYSAPLAPLNNSNAEAHSTPKTDSNESNESLNNGTSESSSGSRRRTPSSQLQQQQQSHKYHQHQHQRNRGRNRR